MSFQNKCILVVFSIVYLFSKNSQCFMFNNVNGTWIVRQTNDPGEAVACPYVKINGTTDRAEFEYNSYNGSFYKLMVNNSKTNVYPVKDAKNGAGNLMIYGGVVPFFLVGSLRLNKEENATYFVLTHRLQLANDVMEKNITNVLKTTAELKNIRFINSTSPKCNTFIKENIKDADQAYPKLPPQVITFPTTTTIKPPTTPSPTITTTMKPGKNGKNNGPILFISKLLTCVSLIFVFIQ